MAPDALQKIVTRKRREVAERMAEMPLATLQSRVADMPGPRNFFKAVVAQGAPGRSRVIAEVKRKSPSAGLIRADFDPVDIARRYHDAGASAISCLTDEADFGGELAFIERIRDAIPLPVLRKDFIVDAVQLAQARLAGADAALLIAAALEPDELAGLFHEAVALGLTPVVEIHAPEELPAVLRLDPPVVAVNNRDLRSLEVDLETTARLAPRIPPGRLLVSASGVDSAQDVVRLAAAGADALLVGTSLMRAADPGQALAELVRAAGRP